MKENNWNKIPGMERIEKTMKSLNENGIKTYFVKSEGEANKKILEIIPENSEVMTMTSVTLDNIGILKEINESGRYDSVRNKLNTIDRQIHWREMQKLGAAPEWAIGSVHAVTEDGKILIASNSGSQLPAHSFGADKVLFVVGVQKIVKDIDDAMKRVYEYSLPLESERAKKAYGVDGSFVSKILLINREIKPDRIHVTYSMG